MDNKKSVDAFREMPVPTLVLRNALPAMLAMIMVLIYNLADTFFIGQTNDALQVAAVSLGTPIFLIFIAIGSLFGVGGTSMISRAMGEGKTDYAELCYYRNLNIYYNDNFYRAYNYINWSK